MSRQSYIYAAPENRNIKKFTISTRTTQSFSLTIYKGVSFHIKNDKYTPYKCWDFNYIKGEHFYAILRVLMILFVSLLLCLIWKINVLCDYFHFSIKEYFSVTKMFFCVWGVGNGVRGCCEVLNTGIQFIVFSKFYLLLNYENLIFFEEQ